MMELIYLHGFASGPQSNKARFFRDRFAERGLPVSVPDLAGGDFEHLTITRQLDVVARAAGRRPVTVVGSSLGGYLAALYAARHPEVQRLVLMAPAFCFARRWPLQSGEEAMAEWRRTGWMKLYHYGYAADRRLSYDLIEDGLKYEDYPKVSQPTLILHGTLDHTVPVALSEEFIRNEPNARLALLESGHELTDVLERLWQETASFLGVEGVPVRTQV